MDLFLLKVKKQAVLEWHAYAQNIEESIDEIMIKKAFKEGFTNGALFSIEWTNPNDEKPLPEKKIIFKLSGNEKRMGIFLPIDQWGRENMFCDGSFHKLETVEGWMYVPD